MARARAIRREKANQPFERRAKRTAEIDRRALSELSAEAPAAKLGHDDSFALFLCAFPFFADVGTLPAFRRRDQHHRGSSIQRGFEILLPSLAGR